MNFYSVRELRTEYKAMWESLKEGDEVVITNNGKPAALMLEIPEGEFDETVRAVRQAKAMLAFQKMRKIAASEGYMREDEVEAEINAAREERRAGLSA